MNMGKHQDMAERKRLARVDNLDRQHRVATARRAIYEEKYAVNSSAVGKLLDKDSLVPTTVCISFSYSLSNVSYFVPERIFQ
jgi:hypothetical protein